MGLPHKIDHTCRINKLTKYRKNDLIDHILILERMIITLSIAGYHISDQDEVKLSIGSDEDKLHTKYYLGEDRIWRSK